MKGIRTGRKTGRLPPRLVLWAMALATVLFRVPERVRRAHFSENTRLWDTLAPAAVENGFIERQEMLAPLRYGVSRKGLSRRLLAGRPLTGGENTCEVIAVYNALGALNMPQPGLPELLRRFEGRGISLGGYFGTSLYALRRFFRKQGCHTAALYGSRADRAGTERLAGAGTVFILTMLNTADNLYDMVHTVCVTKTDGGVTVHNVGEPGRIYPDLYSAVTGYNGGRGRPVWLMARRAPESREGG